MGIEKLSLDRIDGFAKSQSRHPGEPRIRSGAGAGVQNSLVFLDSGFRRNNRKGRFPTFCEFIRINRIEVFQKNSQGQMNRQNDIVECIRRFLRL